MAKRRQADARQTGSGSRSVPFGFRMSDLGFSSMNAAFWIISAITVVGAVLAVTLRNLVHCVLSLILFFLGIAAHYFLLRADFIGAVQILIYVGAVAVLVLFAIMLTRNVTGTESPREVLGGKWWAGAFIAAALAVLLGWAVRSDKIAGALSAGDKAKSSVVEIGRLLIADWVVPFEIMAVLLTSALIGAVVIALEEIRRRP
jgi:NADH-quinone oxidoreductase subunit J